MDFVKIDPSEPSPLYEQVEIAYAFAPGLNGGGGAGGDRDVGRVAAEWLGGNLTIRP